MSERYIVRLGRKAVMREGLMRMYRQLPEPDSQGRTVFGAFGGFLPIFHQERRNGRPTVLRDGPYHTVRAVPEACFADVDALEAQLEAAEEIVKEAQARIEALRGERMAALDVAYRRGRKVRVM